MRGIAIMAAGIFLFSAVDTQAKLLTETLHPLQIVWTRQLGLLLGAIALLVWKGPSLLRSAHPYLQATRGVLAAFSATLFIVAIAYVPLADAVAVSFVAPFIVTVFSALVLREPVGPRRWAAVALGFIGTLIVIRPGMGALHPAAFLVIIAAACFAFRQIISRILGRTDPTITTITYTALFGSAVLTLPLPFVWQWPQTQTEIVLLVTIAISAAAAEILVIRALEIAMAVVVAPVHYSLMIWSTLYGFVVFGDLPDFWTWVGALIIIATGIYTIHRERVVVRQGG